MHLLAGEAYFIKYTHDGKIWHRLWAEDFVNDEDCMALVNAQVQDFRMETRGKTLVLGDKVLFPKSTLAFATAEAAPSWFERSAPRL